MNKMNWKKWKVGLVIATLCGILTAGSGLAGAMDWKSFVAVLCTALLTNIGNFLYKHPVEDIADTNPQAFTKPPDSANNQATQQQSL